MSEDPWVLAAPFRAHVRRLIDQTGLPWPVIALAGGLPPTLIRNLLFGRDGRHRNRLPASAARRLLALDAERLLVHQRMWVPAESAAAVIAELLSQGCPPSSLARYCRLSEPELIAVMESPMCTQLTGLLARAARWQWHRPLRPLPGQAAPVGSRAAAVVEAPARASA